MTAAALFWACLVPGCDATGTTTGTESGADKKHADAEGHATLTSMHPWAAGGGAVSGELDADMVTLVEQAASLLAEIYDPAGCLIFWGARITYLDNRRPCDIYRDGDYAAMRTLIQRLDALADGAFA